MSVSGGNVRGGFSCLWQTRIRNAFASLTNVGETDCEQGPALGAAFLLVPLTFGLTLLDE